MHYNIIAHAHDARPLFNDLKRLKSLAVDTENDYDETDRPTKIIMLQISDGKQAWLIDRRTVDLNIFQPLFENPDIEKIIHNSQHDCAALKNEFNWRTRNIFDTMNGEKLKNGIVIPKDIKIAKDLKEQLYNKYGVSLSDCLRRRGLPDKMEFEFFTWFDKVITVQAKRVSKNREIKAFTSAEFNYLPPEERKKWIVMKQVDTDKLTKWTENQCLYSTRDVEFLHELREDQYNNSFQLNQELTLELENKVAEVFYLMVCRGFSIDVKGWMEMTESNEAIYYKALGDLKKYADLNWQAPAQVCKFFGVKYIKELEELDLKPTSEKGIIYKAWRDARNYANYVNTFGRSWIEQHVRDNRVHCSYTQIINTGRCSSDKPNLQNIPALIKTKHRTFFKPQPGNCFGIADFKGQELAIIAKKSGEESWLECLRQGKDLHSMTGEMTFKQRWLNATGDDRKKMRRIIKDVNFGIAYGMWYEKFALKADITFEEAEEIMTEYERTFPKVKAWIEKNAYYTLKTHVSYSSPPFNRRRCIDTIIEDQNWRIRNIGKNNPVQGTGADMTKLAMIYMNDEFEERIHTNHISQAFYADLWKQKAVDKIKERLETIGICHQMHDELIVEWPTSDKKWMLQTMRDCMVRANTMILGEPLGEPDLIAADAWIKPD